MRYISNKFIKLWNRNEKSRRGSVLILVVVLVVLLALMGTALLSTTQGDRYVAAQHSANTQIDLLVDGVIQIAKSAIADDLYGTYNSNKTFRPPWDTAAAGTAPAPGTEVYENWDMPYSKTGTIDPQNDIWLAPRFPSVLNNTNATPPQTSNFAWSSISTLPGFTTFDSPIAINAATGEASLALPTVYTDRVNAPPRFLTPAFVSVNGSSALPAWIFPAGGGSTVPRYVLAGDADGDGIADSGFFKLPVGELEGLTYYAAVRIIDNNSAINVNTAFSRTNDFDFSGATADTFGTTVTSTDTYNDLGAFPSHVGLLEVVRNPAVELKAIMDYRNNGVSPLSKTPVNDPDQTTHLNTAWQANFEFVSYGDAWANQVAFRLENPGYITAGPSATSPRFNAFSRADSAALARHFMLPALTSPSLLEMKERDESKSQSLLDSIFRSAPNSLDSSGTSTVRGSNAYPQNKFGMADWYNDNFNFDGYSGHVSVQGGLSYDWGVTPATYVRPIRSILTTHNPVSMQVPVRPLPPDTVMATAAYRDNTTNPKGSPTKTNINTAPLEELYRAFWSVMADGTTGGTGTPFTGTATISISDDIYKGMSFTNGYPFKPIVSDFNPQRMFRSSIRVPGGGAVVALDSKDQLRLRAHAAAVQTMQWRDPARAQIVKTLPLPAYGAVSSVNVNTFGSTAQPFISEVFAWYDPTVTDAAGMNKNELPYVAIELFNPYHADIVLDSSYKIYAFDRDGGTWILPIAAMPTPVVTFSGQRVPAGGYLVIDNIGGDVRFEPPSAQISAPILTNGPYYRNESQLTEVLGKEMVIVRDLTGTGAPATLQPIDSYDFSGFPHQTPMIPGANGMAWHYSRATHGNSGEKRWHCVYPGRYDGRLGQDENAPRQQGTEVATWDITTTGNDPWTSTPPPSGVPINLGRDNDRATYPSMFAIPLADVNWPGPNPVGAGTNRWPYGGFGRDGDILQVPFIAAYTITDSNGKLIEINSISMDAAFAEDTDPRDDYPNYDPAVQTPPISPAIDPILPREQIGRFCPIPQILDTTSAVVADDFDDSTADTQTTPHPYAWTRDLFDYLTVRTPASDYMPNASPLIYPSPVPVDNDGVNGAAEESPSPNAGKEDALGVEGKININTAPWIVLSAIPWVPANSANDLFTFDEKTGNFTASKNNVDDNIDIAKAIVFYRDGSPLGTTIAGKGPFKSIFDLYAVTNPQTPNSKFVFQVVQETMGTAKPPGRAEGYLSPLNPGDPQHESRNDFQEQYRILTKVSNLLTTRSDSFTVYILVQGWRGVGTDTPTLAVQRRVAFIQDRSSVTASNPTLPASVNVPND